MAPRGGGAGHGLWWCPGTLTAAGQLGPSGGQDQGESLVPPPGCGISGVHPCHVGAGILPGIGLCTRCRDRSTGKVYLQVCDVDLGNLRDLVGQQQAAALCLAVGELQGDLLELVGNGQEGIHHVRVKVGSAFSEDDVQCLQV
jgi:hypothetical protein